MTESNLYFCVDTYSPIPSSFLLDNFQFVFRHVISQSTTDPNVVFDVVWKLLDSKKINTKRVEEKTWKTIANLSNLEWIVLTGKKEENLHFNKPIYVINLALHPQNSHLSQYTTNFEFSIGLEQLAGNVKKNMQDTIVEWSSEFAEKIQAVNGYLTIDQVFAGTDKSSTYERQISLNYPWAAKNFKEKIRGCYWGNFLSQQHVDILGGEEVLKKAPVYMIKKLQAGCYYLQLTKDINNVDLDKIKELTTFFDPVLPKIS